MTDLERLDQLAELVQRMRRHQIAYFTARNKSDLYRSKALEEQVDAAVNRILDKAPRLFP